MFSPAGNLLDISAAFVEKVLVVVPPRISMDGKKMHIKIEMSVVRASLNEPMKNQIPENQNKNWNLIG